jgi:hypothetical protein
MHHVPGQVLLDVSPPWPVERSAPKGNMEVRAKTISISRCITPRDRMYGKFGARPVSMDKQN